MGTGSIGRELARKARAFDMEVLGVSRHGLELEHFSRVTDDDAEFALFKSFYHLYRQGKPLYNLVDLSVGY